ncbi:hypothetical protein ER308_05215 [Egibacter rhizosphaerae]|uniref:Uncharacterized protein n=1 Tax=Egibacter rhizosphaerae TaxID=1670831 RepID=A0A411YCM8_9ACTN|nr:hypothetical protein [Egibacter rhizosphaerae]QBI19003.1 hypothetical protein ER308_05215 [Egibacter rhizosphaerae]
MSPENANQDRRTVAERAIDEAFDRAKRGLPLDDHQTRIVQFLGNGFGCAPCSHAAGRPES